MFKVGDRVVAHKEITKDRDRWHLYPIPKLSIGKIVKTHLSIRIYSVEFDKHIDGHDCNGRCIDGYGWDVPEEDLSLFFDNINSQIELMLKEVYCLK